MAEVSLENVTKIYPGGVVAVKDMTLNIEDKSFVVFVGPSGCGKTTTLRMIAGLEEITKGTIKIGNRVVNNIPPKNRDIAMVFQNYALYPHMTVYDNMAFGLKLRKYPKDEIDKRVKEAAKILGIENLLTRRPKELSGGQRQRVAVGRAIVRQPKAFLFDEPLSNLDAKMRIETRAELKKLHRRLQTTTIYVTHDQEEAMTLGDKIVVMMDGEIQQYATPLTVYHKPENRFVAGFVGTPPMNFFNGKIIAENEGLYFYDGVNKLLMPERFKNTLVAYKDKEVVMGIRPEYFYPEPVGEFAGKENSIKVKIEIIEPLGDRIDVYMSCPTHPHIVARIDSRAKVNEDTEAIMYIAINRIHIFEPGPTGKNITKDCT